MNPMAGTAVVARPEFSDGPALVAAVARHLTARGILASDIPIAADKGWTRFQAVQREDSITLTLLHWDGRRFPVINGGRGVDQAPLATFVVVLDNSMEDAGGDLLAALSEVLGPAELDQTYMYP